MKTFIDIRDDYVAALKVCREKALTLKEQYDGNDPEKDYLDTVANEVLSDQIEMWQNK